MIKKPVLVSLLSSDLIEVITDRKLIVREGTVNDEILALTLNPSDGISAILESPSGSLQVGDLLYLRVGNEEESQLFSYRL